MWAERQSWPESGLLMCQPTYNLTNSTGDEAPNPWIEVTCGGVTFIDTLTVMCPGKTSRGREGGGANLGAAITGVLMIMHRLHSRMINSDVCRMID